MPQNPSDRPSGAAFLYSDDFLPTRHLGRRTPLGRSLGFCGIYAAFDVRRAAREFSSGLVDAAATR